MKEILYSCPLDPVKLAAPGYHVVNVANELSKQGYKVVLIHQGSQLNGVSVQRQIPVYSPRNGPLSVLGLELKYAFSLNRVLQSLEPRQLVYHRYAKWSILPFLVFSVKRSRVILEVNADLDSEMKSMKRGYLIRKVCSAFENYQIMKSERVIVVSEGIRKSLNVRYPSARDKVHVVENGTDIGTYFPRDRDEACRLLGLDVHCRYVIFAGSLQVWQGVEILVGAAAYLRNHSPKIRILIVGDGVCRHSIEEKVESLKLQDVVHIAGWQSGEVLAQFLAASDICVAPYSSLATLDIDLQENNKTLSLLKCSPLKIYTYMAMGKPVISSNFEDAGARLVDWGVGLCFEPDDERGLANRIIELLNDPERLEEMGKLASRRIVENHTWRHVVERLIKIFGEGKSVGSVVTR